MSTSSRNTSGKRLAALASTGHTLFHIDDLVQLFEMRNENTLRVTLRRYVKNGYLHRIRRGLYSILPPEKIDPRHLGAACLHRFCYLSAETVLKEEGYILQSVDAFTFFSGASRRFTMLGRRYISRRLHPRFLHHPSGIRDEGGLRIASPERAVADMLYIDPWYHFDRTIDWPAIRSLQNEIGYPRTPHRHADTERA